MAERLASDLFLLLFTGERDRSCWLLVTRRWLADWSCSTGEHELDGGDISEIVDMSGVVVPRLLVVTKFLSISGLSSLDLLLSLSSSNMTSRDLGLGGLVSARDARNCVEIAW